MRAVGPTAVTLMLVLAACGDGAGSEATPQGRAGPSARLVVVQELEDDQAVYIEGSVPHLRLEDAAGETVLARGFPAWRGGVLYAGRLPPGRYTLTSWQRPCVATCASLDPPRDRCRATLSIMSERETRVTVRLRPGRGCRIVTR